MFRIGFLGPGNIAHVVVNSLKDDPNLTLYAVASRDIEKAKEFCENYGFQVAYGSYEELYSDPLVDLIYIATPHSFHYEQMMAAIAHHKNVLCEKAFCLNHREATQVFAAAEHAGVFVAEAMVPAYQSSRTIIDDLLKEEPIGDLISYHGVFGASIWHVPRVHEKALGGGALLDIGLYPLYFALSHFGDDPRIEQVYLQEVNNVDQSETIILRYPNRLKATITASTAENLGMYGEIFGNNGSIYIENIARPEWIEVRNNNHEVENRITNLRVGSGYLEEFMAAKEDILAGRKTSSRMKKEDTLTLLDYLDRIRWFQSS